MGAGTELHSLFRVDDETLTVNILRILHRRREWQTLLSEDD
jgi:plasmid stabilization system protein ParE